MWPYGASAPTVWEIVAALGTIGSFLAAGAALWISNRVAREQKRLTEHQLKQDLFDRRFAVYRTVDGFLCAVAGADGVPRHQDMRPFFKAQDEADFLFGLDVKDFLNEVKTKTFRLRTLMQTNERPDGMGNHLLTMNEENRNPIERNSRHASQEVQGHVSLVS